MCLLNGLEGAEVARFVLRDYSGSKPRVSFLACDSKGEGALSAATSSRHIAGVLCGSSRAKMCRVAARWVVTRMQEEWLIFWDGVARQQPRGAMRCHGAAPTLIDAEDAVAPLRGTDEDDAPVGLRAQTLRQPLTVRLRSPVMPLPVLPIFSLHHAPRCRRPLHKICGSATPASAFHSSSSPGARSRRRSANPSSVRVRFSRPARNCSGGSFTASFHPIPNAS